MNQTILVTTLFTLLFMNCKNDTKKVREMASVTPQKMNATTISEPINMTPINHASLVLAYKDVTIYVDPVGDVALYSEHEKPDYIIITDIHGDHLDTNTLQNMNLDATTLIVPKAVQEKLPKLKTKAVIVMNNGDTQNLDVFSIEAIPMYNLRNEALKFHEKGRGNGYVVSLGHERIYISGDTEDIPEMRQLKNIDVAFICMNLPYTMSVESAADAVLDFKPKKIYPYHYRGTDGMSDVVKFKKIIMDNNPDIAVVQLDWYE